MSALAKELRMERALLLMVLHVLALWFVDWLEIHSFGGEASISILVMFWIIHLMKKDKL